jgi:hypothetical protein
VSGPADSGPMYWDRKNVRYSIELIDRECSETSRKHKTFLSNFLKFTWKNFVSGPADIGPMYWDQRKVRFSIEQIDRECSETSRKHKIFIEFSEIYIENFYVRSGEART